MRTDAVWGDVNVHNISKRGMLIRAETAPRIGSIVELRKGQTVVMGRVMWRLDHLFGIRTQDNIRAEALVAPAHSAANALAEPKDRRLDTRSGDRPPPSRAFDQSRNLAGAMQYCVAAIGGAAVACTIAYGLYGLLSAPISVILEHMR